MFNRKIVSLVGVLGLVASGAAWGATSPAGTSEASSPKLLDNLSILGYSDVLLSSVSEPGAGKQYGLGSQTDYVNSYQILQLGWKLTSSSKAIIQERFYLNFGAKDTDFFQQGDIRVGASMSNLLNVGKLSFASLSTTVELPTSSASQAANKFFALRASATQSMEFNRWTASLTEIPRLHFKADGQKFDMLLAPAVSYTVSSTFAPQIWYQNYYVSSNGGLAFDSSEHKLYTYFRWQALPKLEVSPYLMMLPEDMGLRSSTIGFELTGNIL